MDSIHPERREELSSPHYKQLQDIWTQSLQDTAGEDEEAFTEALVRYVEGVRGYRDQYAENIPENLLNKGYDEFRQKIRKTGHWQRMLIKMEYPYVVMDWLMEQLGLPSFPLLGIDARMHYVQKLVELDVLDGGLTAFTFNGEMRLTEFIVHHACYWFKKYGNKAYRVSPDLQWMLENTALKHYPSDGLRLPYPVIYLSLPPKYKVYNDITGWHIAEGVYIVEDVNTRPRCWRLILAALPNEKSVDQYDDAIYHWLIHFPDGRSVEESIQESIDVVYKQHSEGEYKRVLILKDGTEHTFTSVIPATEADEQRLKIFEDMQKIVLPLFRYIMNVVLYSTLPDADVTFTDANPEYAALRRRAIKEKNKRKRKELNRRAQALGSHPRIVLGGSIVISREMKDTSTKGTEDRKQRVRSLVSGHWHHFWTGPRNIPEERKLVKKWVQPYWRGPEAAPLTRKEHVLA